LPSLITLFFGIYELYFIYLYLLSMYINVTWLINYELILIIVMDYIKYMKSVVYKY